MGCFTAFRRRIASPQPTSRSEIDEQISEIRDSKVFSYRELKVATDDFSPANKIGQGGFGSVFKGKLRDGTLVAIKVLSVDSSQGAREFLTEIMVISGVEHENLVKLYGYCAEGDHRILVYGYLENHSLAQTLIGGGSGIQFNWKTRTKICTGIARGLAFLHEEVRPHIVHRDIKASNILLDHDLNPKISDFGLAKLLPPSMTHVSTRVAGTMGYLAPEYAVRGRLTRKADIYSFGILMLEIISGRSNTNKQLPYEEHYLLERMWKCYEQEDLIQLVDMSMGGEFDVSEACKFLKIGLLCTQEMPKDRPSMTEVVKMLTGETDLDEDLKISRPGLISELMSLRGGRRNASSAVSSSTPNTTITYATMTFTSIDDRSAYR
ncbi:transmembrane signal receptor [Lithospermum erythrorhizon]|uniref:Transmembrane signal receptor n=1 Tax=Lithospermum erythrorhizon TaxID=34254 RepID=A0AAV3QFV1_LITER